MQLQTILDHVDLNKVLGILATVVTMYLIPALKAHADASRASATNDNLDVKSKLHERLTGFFCGTAAKLLETKFPSLVLHIESGQLKTKAELLDEVKSWVSFLKQDALDHYTPQNIDLIKHLGEPAIDRLITNTLVKLPQFANDGKLAAQLTSAVNQIVDTTLTAIPVCRACIPVCSDCPLQGVKVGN